MTESYTFSSKGKTVSLVLIAIGLLATILGFVVYEPTRVFANLLHNSYYFMGIALIGIFFVAVNSVGYGGWYVLIKRIAEAVGSFIAIPSIFLLLVAVGAFMHWHHIYHWAHEGIADPASPHYDALIAGKMPYFQPVFFMGRILAYVILWTLFAFVLRKLSLQEDQNPDLRPYKKSKVFSALFLIIFAVTSSSVSWDLIMSIDTHWYSTLFGWYNFASYFVSGIALITLIIIYFKA